METAACCIGSGSRRRPGRPPHPRSAGRRPGSAASAHRLSEAIEPSVGPRVAREDQRRRRPSPTRRRSSCAGCATARGTWAAARRRAPCGRRTPMATRASQVRGGQREGDDRAAQGGPDRRRGPPCRGRTGAGRAAGRSSGRWCLRSIGMRQNAYSLVLAEQWRRRVAARSSGSGWRARCRSCPPAWVMRKLSSSSWLRTSVDVEVADAVEDPLAGRRGTRRSRRSPRSRRSGARCCRRRPGSTWRTRPARPNGCRPRCTIGPPTAHASSWSSQRVDRCGDEVRVDVAVAVDPDDHLAGRPLDGGVEAGRDDARRVVEHVDRGRRRRAVFDDAPGSSSDDGPTLTMTSKRGRSGSPGRARLGAADSMCSASFRTAMITVTVGRLRTWQP